MKEVKFLSVKEIEEQASYLAATLTQPDLSESGIRSVVDKIVELGKLDAALTPFKQTLRTRRPALRLRRRKVLFREMR